MPNKSHSSTANAPLINEASLDFLESHIPELADAAFKQAYWQALASGSSVLEVDQGHIVEVFPDGSRKTIKKIDEPIPVTVGHKRINS